MTAVTLNDLTTGTVDGTGVFDRLMVTCKAHLDLELKKNSIKGPEYAQVYLGQVQQIMQTAVQFLATSQKIDLEAQLLKAQVDQVKAQSDLVKQQLANAIQENKNLVAQECLLKAQYDNTVQMTARVTKETELTSQKIVTEKAQTTEFGVDENSVVGQQKKLYGAQATGFTRDAEQKATKLILDTWQSRRMTDDATVADGVNNLNDVMIGRFVSKLAAGIGA